MRVFPWIMWYIWKVRNHKIFENVNKNPQDILEEAAWRRHIRRYARRDAQPSCSEPASAGYPDLLHRWAWHASDTKSG